MRKLGLLVALAVTLMASQGCAAVGRYFQYRYHDFTQMVDGGFTFTTKPCIGLYWNSLDLLVAGYCNIDGYFLGWGGNQIGLTPVHSYCYGLIVSREEVGWGRDFDVNKPETMYIRYGGLAGLASIAGTGTSRGTPDYTPACVHFIPHIGFVGIVWNARWTQILDFVLGWTTLDIDGDDGYKFGKWPWQKRTRFERNVKDDSDVAARLTGPYRRVEGQEEPLTPVKPAASSDHTAITLTVRHDKIPSETEQPALAEPTIAPVPADVRSHAPAVEEATGVPSGGRTYTVQKGDNLFRIAQRFYGDGSRWKDIQAANPDTAGDERALRPGALLTIP